MLLSQMLRKLMREKGLTPSKTARMAGISVKTLHGWEQGRAVRDMDALQKVAVVLTVPVHVLLYGTPDPFEAGNDDALEHLFSGDVRITVHKILKKKR